MEDRGGPALARARVGAAVFVSLAGVACAMALIFLGMRSVMKIGGFCAEGGPYVIQHPCPRGVTAVMFGGFWGGAIAVGVYLWQTVKHRIPSLVWLFWPALFLSLGWNFLEFGINPPGGGGPSAGWLVCAVLFILIGGVPLVLVGPLFFRHLTSPEPVRPAGPFGVPPGTLRSAIGALSTLRKVQRSAVADVLASAPSAPTRPAGASSPSSREAGDVVSKLERLDALHRSGALDDAEYETVKREVLGERDGG